MVADKLIGLVYSIIVGVMAVKTFKPIIKDYMNKNKEGNETEGP